MRVGGADFSASFLQKKMIRGGGCGFIGGFAISTAQDGGFLVVRTW
jgi:hypothetical protein